MLLRILKTVHLIAASALGPTCPSSVQDLRGSTVLRQFHHQEGKFFLSGCTGTFKYSVFGASSWCPEHLGSLWSLSWEPLLAWY